MRSRGDAPAPSLETLISASPGLVEEWAQIDAYQQLMIALFSELIENPDTTSKRINVLRRFEREPSYKPPRFQSEDIFSQIKQGGLLYPGIIACLSNSDNLYTAAGFLHPDRFPITLGEAEEYHG